MGNLLSWISPAWGWLTSGVLITLLLWVLRNPDKSELIVSRVLRLVSWAFTKAARAAVSKEIQGRIGEVSKRLNKAGGQVLPEGLRIHWVESTSPEALIQDGSVLVRMRDHGGQAQNMAVATLQYVKSGLLPEAKMYLDAKTSGSLDLTVTRRILADEFPNSLPYFHTTYVQPVYANDVEVQKLMDSVATVDEKGLLFPVFLNQLRDTTALLWPHHQPTRELAAEMRGFLEFLFTIASKERRADAELSFHGKHVDACVVLVGRIEKLRERGLDPYERAVDIHVNDHLAKTIYLCGFGASSPFVGDLATVIMLKPYTSEVTRYRFTFKTAQQDYSGMCARVKVKADYKPMRLTS